MRELAIKEAVWSEYRNLFEVDQRIYNLVKDIELLNYVNPVNIESEKRRFFESKYLNEPKFQYKPCPVDVFKLQQQLFSISIDKVEDEPSQEFYKDLIYAYSNLLQCLGSIGQGRKFYFNSLKSFGTPTGLDVQNAEFILHFIDEEERDEYVAKYTVDEAIAYFEKRNARYDFHYKIRIEEEMAASAMVENDTQTLVLKKNHRFSENELAVLFNHEVGIHLVTTFNGLAQPLKVFHSGFPGNVETQEGLALMSEYMSQSLTLHRLKELAYRVLATNGLRRGYTFTDTFDMLHNQYKVDREHAFRISLRVHRGGGFTKDYVYLSGFKNMYKRHYHHQDLNLLILGKVSDSYDDLIRHWKKLGLITPLQHESQSLKANQNQNQTYDFILKNLR